MKKAILLWCIWVSIFISMKADAQKIGYVNMQQILTSMPESAQTDTVIKVFQQQLYQQYQAMQEEFKQEADSYVKDSAKMNTAVKQVKLGSLQDLNRRMVQFRQSINQDVLEKYSELMKPIINKVQTAVHRVASGKGYAYVINDLKQNGIPFLVTRPDSDNLTAAVKANLGVK